MNNEYRNQNRRSRRLWSTWSTFFFVFFFFYIIGDLVIGWWHNEVWVWIMLAFFLFSAVTSTIRYFVYRNPRISPDAGTRYHTTNSSVPDYIPESDPQYLPAQSEQSKSFCKFCGVDHRNSAQYCANCGALIEE
ncbi:MAG: zinc ribbon domain-containing protein [Candidatus Heimdallarchaeota archaeon]|nr:zinc ribbon domain-containing protein [Candidatus Heimdallarchaeota archaeon]MBY8994899.1 zinc ribbon domain-containing protein [Candidatus Heimdallarchaeota archaeon]